VKGRCCMARPKGSDRMEGLEAKSISEGSLRPIKGSPEFEKGGMRGERKGEREKES